MDEMRIFICGLFVGVILGFALALMQPQGGW
jgi:hypothetical protein